MALPGTEFEVHDANFGGVWVRHSDGPDRVGKLVHSAVSANALINYFKVGDLD